MKLSKIFYLSILFFFICLTNAKAFECNLNNAKTSLSKATSYLSNNIKIMRELLNGEKGSISSGIVFGDNFNISKSEQIILAIEKGLMEPSTLQVQYGFLFDCLRKLKLNSGVKDLEILLKQFGEIRIKIIQKNVEVDNAIFTQLNENKELPDLKGELQRETQNSRIEQAKIATQIYEEEYKATKDSDPKLKELRSYKANLKKIKLELINRKLELVKILEDKLAYFDEQGREVSKLLSSPDNFNGAAVDNFNRINQIWLEVSKRNYYLFEISSSFDLPEIPEPLALIQSRETLVNEINEVNELRAEIIKERVATVQDLTFKKNQEVRLQNELLLKVNSARAVLFNRVPNSYLNKLIFSKELYYFILKEFKGAPFRIASFFYSKFLYAREQVSKGPEGIKKLSYDILLIGLFILLIAGIKVVYSGFSSWFDEKLSFNTNYSNSRPIVKRILGLWNRMKGNAQDVLWLLTIAFLKELSFLSDVVLVLTLVQVVLTAKILRAVVVIFFGSISRIDVRSFSTFKRKADLSAAKLTNIYLFYAFSLILADATIGKVYVFLIIKILVIFYAITRIIGVSTSWEEELSSYLERHFSGYLVKKLDIIFKILPTKLRSTFYLFVILVFSLLNVFIKATENLEISKKISANIFKKQIEAVEAGEDSVKGIPEKYRENFLLQSVSDLDNYVQVNEKLFEGIKTEFDEWIEEKNEEHSLVIYGDKGIGKTTLMKYTLGEVEKERPGQLDIKITKVPSKLTDKKTLQQFVCDTLEQKIEEGESFDLYRIDNALEKKTIIFLDECQNVFLSEAGGFACYQALVNMINFNTKNLFWVMSFNKYSWLYLDRAFGRSQFFRNVFEIKGWSDLKIKELIMSRHSKTDFKLSFDLLISATRSQDEIDRYASVESKFFKLIWELSRGNPRAALYLWMTSLSRKREKVFNVNVPREADLLNMDKLPDDILFVLSHILKHENLTSREIEATTNLPTGIVRNAIKVGLERNYLYKDERSRYMIDISTQYGIIRFLTQKNFVYGS